MTQSRFCQPMGAEVIETGILVGGTAVFCYHWIPGFLKPLDLEKIPRYDKVAVKTTAVSRGGKMYTAVGSMFTVVGFEKPRFSAVFFKKFFRG